jgi:hypothetical protein
MKKINKICILLLAAFGLLISGCTTKINYESNTMYELEKKYTFDIVVEHTNKVNALLASSSESLATLYINDEIVLQGPLKIDNTGTLRGQYNNETLILECSKYTIFSDTICLIHLGNKRIGKSTLKIARY